MIGVIVNPRAGFVTHHGLDGLQAMINVAVPDAHVHLLQPHVDVHSLCQELLSAGAACIAAVGGDGTVSAVAACLVDTQVPLGVIPGGTLNHFARDVGVGRHVPEAIRILAQRHAVPVDVASVNDRIFLNNSSLGLYPEMVYLRETEEQQLGKWGAMVRALVLATRITKWTNVRIETGENAGEARTRLLFVGNNRYALRLLHLGRRESLQEGVLSCFILDAPNRFHLVRTVLRSLRGDHSEHTFLRSLQATEITVIPYQEHDVEVSADGEICSMRTPLVYRIRPKALHVIVPPPGSPAHHASGSSPLTSFDARNR
jgi:diacylglycerol kinase family enzyme